MRKLEPEPRLQVRQEVAPARVELAMMLAAERDDAVWRRASARRRRGDMRGIAWPRPADDAGLAADLDALPGRALHAATAARYRLLAQTGLCDP